MTANVLIAGAGDIGQRLGARLLKQGCTVHCLRRDTASVPKELGPISADLTDPDAVEAALMDVGDLTHVAYTAAASESSDEGYAAAYVLGLSNVLAQTQLSQPRFQRLVFISSTAVYAQADDSWVDERSETRPTHFAGKRTVEAEQLLASSGVETCALRCGGIYGPGRTRLIDMVRSGQATYDEHSAQFTNRIHTDDVVGALAFLLFQASPPSLVNGVDELPAPRKEVLNWLAERLGAPAPTPADSTDPSAGRRKPGSKRVSSELLRSLGYRFRYPSFRDGYAELLAGL